MWAPTHTHTHTALTGDSVWWWWWRERKGVVDGRGKNCSWHNPPHRGHELESNHKLHPDRQKSCCCSCCTTNKSIGKLLIDKCFNLYVFISNTLFTPSLCRWHPSLWSCFDLSPWWVESPSPGENVICSICSDWTILPPSGYIFIRTLIDLVCHQNAT